MFHCPLFVGQIPEESFLYEKKVQGNLFNSYQSTIMILILKASVDGMSFMSVGLAALFSFTLTTPMTLIACHRFHTIRKLDHSHCSNSVFIWGGWAHPSL